MENILSETDQTVRDEIVAALRGSPHPLGPKEVSDAIEADYGYVRKQLGELLREGLVTKPSRGRYEVQAGEQDVPDGQVSKSGRTLPGLSAPAALVTRLQRNVALTLYTAVCAGDGAIIFDEASRISVEIPVALAFHFFGFQPPLIMGVSEVVGDSMRPMFEPGDLVLYDLTPDAGGGGVFVINYDGKAACKRVQPVGRSYRLIPENRVYSAELIRTTAEGYVHDETGDLIEFGIVGRILFPRPETPRLHIQQVGDLLRGMFREAAAGR